MKASKPAQVFRLYPEPPKLAAVHANALLAFLAEQCPQAAGQWVLVADLARAYREFAERERWVALHWNGVGRELTKIAPRKSVKRGGRRYTAYQMPD